MDTLQYAIYKGTGGKFGAVQFNFQPPNWYQGKQKDFTGSEALDPETRRPKEGWKLREGAIFMQITSATGKNVYDWANKIVMALSITDIGRILLTLATGNECKLMHDPGAKTESQGTTKKYLNFTSPDGTTTGVIISSTQVSGGDKRTHTVGLTGDEVIVLKTLLQQAIIRALNW